MIDIRLFHHVEELPRIGRQRFHVTTLTLGIDRVERQRRLARPGQARDHHKFVARNIDVDVLEVVLARAAHLDVLQLGHVPPGSEWVRSR